VSEHVLGDYENVVKVDFGHHSGRSSNSIFLRRITTHGSDGILRAALRLGETIRFPSTSRTSKNLSISTCVYLGEYLNHSPKGALRDSFQNDKGFRSAEQTS